MPFKSQAQRAFMYAQHPRMAKRWEKHTPDKKLPEKKTESSPEETQDKAEAEKAKKKGKEKKSSIAFFRGYEDGGKL